jgi:hypothetical protein
LRSKLRTSGYDYIKKTIGDELMLAVAQTKNGISFLIDKAADHILQGDFNLARKPLAELGVTEVAMSEFIIKNGVSFITDSPTRDEIKTSLSFLTGIISQEDIKQAAGDLLQGNSLLAEEIFVAKKIKFPNKAGQSFDDFVMQHGFESESTVETITAAINNILNPANTAGIEKKATDKKPKIDDIERLIEKAVSATEEGNQKKLEQLFGQLNIKDPSFIMKHSGDHPDEIKEAINNLRSSAPSPVVERPYEKLVSPPGQIQNNSLGLGA